MTQTCESCRENAEAALIEAERATLPNVRARSLEAAARWTEMADRLERVEKHSQVRMDAINQARENKR